MGGDFTDVNGSSFNGIARLNTDGSIDARLFPRHGRGRYGEQHHLLHQCHTTTVSVIVTNGDSPVTNTLASAYNVIYVGGSFTSFNGTRRLGFARLYTDGTVDTSFLDTAYNQFAGLVADLFRRYARGLHLRVSKATAT